MGRPNVDQATTDRAVAVLLELAENEVASFGERYSAAVAILDAGRGVPSYPSVVEEVVVDEPRDE